MVKARGLWLASVDGGRPCTQTQELTSQRRHYHSVASFEPVLVSLFEQLQAPDGAMTVNPACPSRETDDEQNWDVRGRSARAESQPFDNALHLHGHPTTPASRLPPCSCVPDCRVLAIFSRKD